MDLERAKKIMDTNIEVEVFYNNDSVWIMNLDESTGMANVEIMKNSTELQVPVSDLMEEGMTQ